MVIYQRESNEKRSLEYINSNCIACGICIETCPTNAIDLISNKNSNGNLKKNSIVINNDDCTFCGICSISCPFDALNLKIKNVSIKEMEEYPKWNIGVNFNDDNCIYCQRCHVACPQGAITVTRELPNRYGLLIGKTNVNTHDCIFCGICQEMCPADAITLNRDNFLKRSDEDIKIDESKCLYCKICQLACPTDAIDIRCSGCMDKDDIVSVEIKGEFILEDPKCVKCGWCEITCPFDCITVKKPFKGSIEYDEDILDSCDGCKECIDVCSCNAISITNNKFSVNEDYCVLCGACALVCPEEGIKVNRTETALSNINSSAWKKHLSKITGDPV